MTQQKLSSNEVTMTPLRYTVRFHIDTLTVDQDAVNIDAAIDLAEHAMQTGVWSNDGLKLYPPSRVALIELIPTVLT